MKRYNLKSKLNTVAADHGVVTSELVFEEDPEGEYVSYEDAQAMIQKALNFGYHYRQSPQMRGSSMHACRQVWEETNEEG